MEYSKLHEEIVIIIIGYASIPANYYNLCLVSNKYRKIATEKTGNVVNMLKWRLPAKRIFSFDREEKIGSTIVRGKYWSGDNNYFLIMQFPIGEITWQKIGKTFSIYSFKHSTPMKDCEFVNNSRRWIHTTFGKMGKILMDECCLFCECEKCISTNKYNTCNVYGTPQILELKVTNTKQNEFYIKFRSNITVLNGLDGEGIIIKGVLTGEWSDIMMDGGIAYTFGDGISGNYQWLLTNMVANMEKQNATII